MYCSTTFFLSQNEISIEELEGYLSDDEDCDKCDGPQNDAPLGNN